MLFRWRSKALAQYGLGHIIVDAQDEQNARWLAETYINEVLRDDAFLCDDEGNFIDAESEQEFNERFTLFKADIEREPEIIRSGVLLIDGSE